MTSPIEHGHVGARPYYEDKAGIVLYHGDCLEVLPALKKAGVKVDVVVTDPPYNARDMGRDGAVYAEGPMRLPAAEYAAWCERWFAAARGLTERIVFTSGTQNIGLYPPALWTMAWVKPGVVGFSKLGGFAEWEPILVYGKPPGSIPHDVITMTPANFYTDEWSKHPCPKHPRLWKWLVSQVTAEGETVLDPFLGSGTTARVCKDLGRRCIGIERVESYVQMSVRRLAQEVMPLGSAP